MLPFLEDNQFATGLLATTVLAACLASLRSVPGRLWTYLWAQFAVCAEIKNTDPSFNWISIWLDQQPYSKKTRHLSVYTYHDDNDDGPDYCEYEHQKKKNRPKVLFTPAQGQHLFWYQNSLVWLTRSKAETPAGGGMGTKPQAEREGFSIWVLGRNQDKIRSIIQDAMELALPEGAPETCVIPSADGRWQSALRRKPRPKNSVILADGIIDGILSDIKQFLINKPWYDNLGIPYRRGYLLHGIPGAGKTSVVLAAAGELGLDVYMINLGDRYLDDGRLNYLLAQVPPGNIVLLEDIDAAFQTRETPKDEDDDNTPKSTKTMTGDAVGITFSGLLNALDGVAAKEGRLLFMTTNHKDKLDPALIRPGRADVHILFDYATPSQAEQMLILPLAELLGLPPR
jgi:hypothetical protein